MVITELLGSAMVLGATEKEILLEVAFILEIQLSLQATVGITLSCVLVLNEIALRPPIASTTTGTAEVKLSEGSAAFC